MEWYRSGHNEAVSKTVSQRKLARGFESHSLRQMYKERRKEVEDNMSVENFAIPINVSPDPEDSMPVKISNQILINPTAGSDSVKVEHPGKNIVGILQVISMLLISVGLIAGIIYMIKSKKTVWKKIVIGIAIIVIPIIIAFVLSTIKYEIAIA